MNQFLSSGARRAAVLLVVLSLGAGGCTSKYGHQITQVDYYPQCYQPMADLRADEHIAAKPTGIGAVVGALMGGVIGGLSTGKVEGALTGAVAGGIAGGAAGYAYGASKQKQIDEQHLQTYLGQLQGEATAMDRATAAAMVASQCYNTQFELAVGAVRSGQMTKTEFSTRYAEIRNGLQETAQLLTDTDRAMAQKEAEYREVLAATNQSVAPEPKPGQKPASPAPPKSAPAKPAQTTTRAVAASAARWQKSRTDLHTAQNSLQEQMNAYERTVAALEG